jgi:thiol-disulfide isomerase/thioredoxin
MTRATHLDMRQSVVASLMAAALTLLAAGSARAGEYPAEWFWGDEAQRAKHEELVGKEMPALELDGWRGKAVTAADMKGKIVVVDFWATWCGPCIAAIPKNNDIAKDYAEKGVLVVGVCGSSRGQERMEAVAEQHGVAYPVAKDSTNKSAEAWRVMWWPTYGVVDRKGKLRALGLKPNHVKDVVDKLLAEAPAAKEAASVDGCG